MGTWRRFNLQSIRFKALDVIQNEIIAKDQYREISLESVKDYAGDYIIFEGEVGKLENNSVWQSIPAR